MKGNTITDRKSITGHLMWWLPGNAARMLDHFFILKKGTLFTF